MKNKIIEYQEKTLKLLAGRLEGFYLSGGTALSLYYFHHRESLDLDFFTPRFNKIAIKNIVEELSQKLKKGLS